MCSYGEGWIHKLSIATPTHLRTPAKHNTTTTTGQANTTSGPRPIRAAGAASAAAWPTFEAPRVAPAGDAAAVWRRFRGS